MCDHSAAACRPGTAAVSPLELAPPFCDSALVLVCVVAARYDTRDIWETSFEMLKEPISQREPQGEGKRAGNRNSGCEWLV